MKNGSGFSLYVLFSLVAYLIWIYLIFASSRSYEIGAITGILSFLLPIAGIILGVIGIIKQKTVLTYFTAFVSVVALIYLILILITGTNFR